jgi:hypothetical protein
MENAFPIAIHNKTEIRFKIFRKIKIPLKASVAPGALHLSGWN